MNERRNGQPQIAAVTEHFQTDPIATAYDRLQASVAAGKDDPDARATLQAALPLDTDEQAMTGTDVAEALRLENATEQERARRTIRALIDQQIIVPEGALISNWKPEDLRVSRPFLLEGWLPSGRPAILFADGGVGKTWLALALCAGIARPPAAGPQGWLHNREEENVDIPVIGKEFRTGAPVLFATYEDEMPDVFYRLSAIRFGGTDKQSDAWRNWEMPAEMPDLQVLDMVGLGLGPCWGTPEGELTNRRNELLPAGEAVRKVAEEHDARLLVIDSLAACYASNENGRGSVHEFLRSWDEWGRVQSCTTLFVAHTNKAGEFSGSTAWHNAVRTRWHLEYEKIGIKPKSNQPDTRESVPVLTCEKVNYGAKPEHGVYLTRGNGGRWEAIARPTAENTTQSNESDQRSVATRRNGKSRTQRSKTTTEAPRDETKLKRLGG